MIGLVLTMRQRFYITLDVTGLLNEKALPISILDAFVLAGEPSSTC